jgi:Cu/Ag efflux pump CusA
VFASGAGAEIRQAMGIAVFSGMLGVTVFGLFLTPVFFVFVGRAVGWVTERPRRVTRQVPATVEGGQ